MDTPTPLCVKMNMLHPGLVGVACEPVSQGDSTPPPLLPPVLQPIALPTPLLPLTPPTQLLPLVPPAQLLPLPPPAQLLPLTPSSSPPVECNMLLDDFTLNLDTEPDSSDDEDGTVGHKSMVSSVSSIACSTSSASTISTRSNAQVGKSSSFISNHIQLRNGRILPSIVSPSKESKEVSTSSSSGLLCESSSSCESVSDELERSLKIRGRRGTQTHATRGIKGQLKKIDLSTQSDHGPSHVTRKGASKQQQQISVSPSLFVDEM